jgi:hypothetical protein
MQSGGCACGAVRYRIEGELFDTGWCHCRLCQRSSGAPAIAFSSARIADFDIEAVADRLRAWRSTSFGERQFCAVCGSLLTIRVDFQPETIDIAAATLDQPEIVRPEFHIFCKDALVWAPVDDGLPRYEAFRPETRGLAPGQTMPE